jgi:hypothetical protein
MKRFALALVMLMTVCVWRNHTNSYAQEKPAKDREIRRRPEI